MPVTTPFVPLRGACLQRLQWLVAGDLALGVDAARGGRIVSFSRNGEEILTPASVHPDNYGSTLWDSPQRTWDWPPRAVLDIEPYGVSHDGDTLVLESGVDPCGLRFTKRIRVEPGVERIELEYRISNCGDAPVRVAPWEVTRTAGGLSFFPFDPSDGLPATDLQPVVRQDGICWYPFAPAVLEKGRKLFELGGEGWLAHVGRGQRLLFVKTFPVTPRDALAPGQGAVEIWGHDEALYVELENHGPYVLLAPGEQISYPVCWYLEPLPADLRIGVGESGLVALAREIAAR
ncbi:DUF4380 domain-containing protein [Niveibacterium sp.]|uniref:DUF4380 domain-containing protein n=1 Tax=Niveibacterium sp. TaxID=2017444 RepID=UPI0035AD9E64